MKKGGLTAKEVEAKLRELHGNMAAVGRVFGVTRQAVYDFCKKRPSLMAVSADVREAMKDNGESALYAAVLRGEAWAVCFYLKTQAKDRGYTERQELTGKNGGPMEHRDMTDDQLRARIAAGIERLARGRPSGAT